MTGILLRQIMKKYKLFLCVYSVFPGLGNEPGIFYVNCNLFNLTLSLSYSGGLVEHLCRTYIEQQSVTKIIPLMFINLVTPKAQTKHELLFNKPVSEAPHLI